jgi:hypothetical protein
MKIRISDKAYHIYIGGVHNGRTINWEWADKLKELQGETLEVETEYLFRDQFNTAPIDGISDNGMRIMAESVAEVIDDERPGRMRCEWCGAVSVVSSTCSNCERDDHLKVFDMTHHNVVAHMSRLS